MHSSSNQSTVKKIKKTKVPNHAGLSTGKAFTFRSYLEEKSKKKQVKMSFCKINFTFRRINHTFDKKIQSEL